MAAEMKASVLLTLKDELTGKVKAAAKGLGELAGAAGKIKGTTALGKMATEAGALVGAAEKAASAIARVGSISVSGNGFAAATKAADAYAAAAGRAAAASHKAASAASVAARPTGADIYYHGAKAEAAAKGRTPIMAVRGSETERATAIANNLDRANPTMYAGKKGAALLEKHTAEELERQKAGGGGGGGFMAGAGNKAMGAYFGYQIAKGGLHAVDSVVSKVGDVSAMREKLTWAMGGDKAGADAAYAKALELSGKYKNTTVLENLHVIDDLRANLPETMDHILHDAADPFVKMHGFFKAWQGGKHAGTAEHALKDVGAAIRAGELTGISSADDLVKHTQAIAKARILFGEKFSVPEYLQGVQKSATALSSADDTYKYVDFPILLQRLSQKAGVALRVGFQKFVAGATVSQEVAENWRKLDLVDMDKVKLDKGGQIKAASLLGTSWLKIGDELGVNSADAIMTKVVPALAEKGGLKDLAGLDEAWKAGDVERAAQIMKKFRANAGNMVKLSQAAIGLAKDPSAALLLEETITGAPSNLRERQRSKAIDGNVEKFSTYDKAKQELSAQADRLLQTVAGDDVDGLLGKAASAAAGFIGNLATHLEVFKGVSKAVEGIDAEIAAINKTGPETEGWGSWFARKLGFGKSDSALPMYASPATVQDIQAYGALPSGAGGVAGAKARAEAAGGRYQLGGSELAEAQAAGGADVFADAGAAAAEATAKLREFAAGPQVPTMLGGAMADTAQPQAPESIAIVAEGPSVTFNQAPPNISVNTTINVTTNAAPAEIGAAVGGHVSTAVRGAMHDGGN